MKKKISVILSLIFAIAISMVPANAADIEGRPQSPNAFDGAEIVEAYEVNLKSRSRDVLLGSYTIQNYLNDGYMKFTNESFGASSFPDDGIFRFETNLTTAGKDGDIKVGIAYTDWFGTDIYFVSTKMGLSDNKLFTCTKTPSDSKAYYGCISNDTGGKMYGSFAIYAVYAE